MGGEDGATDDTLTCENGTWNVPHQPENINDQGAFTAALNCEYSNKQGATKVDCAPKDPQNASTCANPEMQNQLSCSTNDACEQKYACSTNAGVTDDACPSNQTNDDCQKDKNCAWKI